MGQRVIGEMGISIRMGRMGYGSMLVSVCKHVFVSVTKVSDATVGTGELEVAYKSMKYQQRVDVLVSVTSM